mgnify:FL=1
MLEKGKLLKIYIGESEKFGNKTLYKYLVNWLREKGIGGVTVSRGVLGYGHDKVLKSAKILELSSDLPMVIETIDCSAKIEAIIPELCKIVPKGLVFTVDVDIHKYGTEEINCTNRQ